MMTNSPSRFLEVPVVEEDLPLSLAELCRACGATEELVIAWVFEGILEPAGPTPQDWLFTGPSMRRARLALWLTRDLEVNAAGAALAVDLLDEIAALRARLHSLGVL
jgi:chaperone modulatory protein CbpM